MTDNDKSGRFVVNFPPYYIANEVFEQLPGFKIWHNVGRNVKVSKIDQAGVTRYKFDLDNDVTILVELEGDD